MLRVVCCVKTCLKCCVLFVVCSSFFVVSCLLCVVRCLFLLVCCLVLGLLGNVVVVVGVWFSCCLESRLTRP